MVDREPHHHPALVALRRMERALCAVETARDHWKLAGLANGLSGRAPEDNHNANQAYDAYVDALDELRAARGAAIGLLQREGLSE